MSGSSCNFDFGDLMKGLSLPIIFGLLTPIFFYLWNNKISTKKIMISSVIVGIIITVGIFAFIGFLNSGKDYRMTGHEVYDELYDYFNITQQQIENLTYFVELTKNKEINIMLSNDKFREIDDFFKENGHPLGDITYFKYQDEFYSIEFDNL